MEDVLAVCRDMPNGASTEDFLRELAHMPQEQILAALNSMMVNNRMQFWLAEPEPGHTSGKLYFKEVASEMGAARQQHLLVGSTSRSLQQAERDAALFGGVRRVTTSFVPSSMMGDLPSAAWSEMETPLAVVAVGERAQEGEQARRKPEAAEQLRDFETQLAALWAVQVAQLEAHEAHMRQQKAESAKAREADALQLLAELERLRLEKKLQEAEAERSKKTHELQLQAIQAELERLRRENQHQTEVEQLKRAHEQALQEAKAEAVEAERRVAARRRLEAERWAQEGEVCAPPSRPAHGGGSRLHVKIWSTKAASSGGGQTPFGVHLKQVAGPEIVVVDVDFNHETFQPRVLSMSRCADGVTWSVERNSWGVTAVLVTVTLAGGAAFVFEHDARCSRGVDEYEVDP